jgi:hypothetical protein
MNQQLTTPAPEKAPIDSTDAAWVSVPARQSVESLTRLCEDIEAIVRVNPYYVYNKKWRQTSEHCYETDYNNLSNDQQVHQTLCVDRESPTRWVIRYEGGLKTRTVLEIEPTEFGSKLTITDDYEGIGEAERKSRQHEVDKSLKAWGQGLYAYFLKWRRFSWIPGWKWYTRKIWIPMKPSARRITYMLLMIELAFAGLFFFSMLILWIEKTYN